MVNILDNIYIIIVNRLKLFRSFQIAAPFRSSLLSRQMDIDDRSLLQPAIEGHIS